MRINASSRLSRSSATISMPTTWTILWYNVSSSLDSCERSIDRLLAHLGWTAPITLGQPSQYDHRAGAAYTQRIQTKQTDFITDQCSKALVGLCASTHKYRIGLDVYCPAWKLLHFAVAPSSAVIVIRVPNSQRRQCIHLKCLFVYNASFGLELRSRRTNVRSQGENGRVYGGCDILCWATRRIDSRGSSTNPKVLRLCWI